MQADKKIVKEAKESLIKKLSDHMEIVEITTEEGSGGVRGSYEKKITKEKLVKADLNAIIFALKVLDGENWNHDEKEINEAKIAKMKAEVSKLSESSEHELSEKLMNYVSEQPENL